MKLTRLIICGGFLGAGKTTLIWDVAQRLMAQGLRVGLVTNDQAPELVDSHLLQQANLTVAEVAGSCFCCNFEGFKEALINLRHEAQADVILAEPVGSCTDLTATIVRPLRKYLCTEVVLSPLTVLSDPIRLMSILYGNAGLHDDAAYIYMKQLEESEVILVTKADLIAEEQLEKLVSDLQARFPQSKVMTASTMRGTGIMEWYQEVSNRESSGATQMDVDYDKYAHGEAVLGWLNGTVTLTAPQTYWDAVLKSLMNGMAQAIQHESLGVGHIKVIAENGKQYAVGNITGDATTLQFRGTAGTSDSVRLIINARVETSPEHLDALVRHALQAALPIDCQCTETAWRFLMPGRPNPTYHIDA